MELAVKSRISQLVISGASLVTLAITPWLHVDAINLPKLMILSSVSFSIFLLILVNRNVIRSFSDVPLFFSLSLFVLWLFVAFLFSGAPLNQQFWGVFGRQNGLLSYVCLSMILFGASLFSDKRGYVKLLNGFLITAMLVTLYASIQKLGKDPVSWSQKMVFGTLGNINFYSAFAGMSALVALLIAFSMHSNIFLKAGLVILAVGNIYLAYDTGSIQGPMIFIAGIGVVGFLWLRSVKIGKFLLLPYLLISVAGLILTCYGLANRGPLSKIVYAPSVTYRGDYWHAGWEMSVMKPIFGVGLDSYGDWYRQVRGLISTTRTNPERTANTAHNIFLDLSASGGFPLLLFYLLILGCALRSSIIYLRRTRTFDPYFTSIFVAWIMFLIQALISIGQIGVTVWGWVFTGALIGYERVSRAQLPIEKNERTSKGKAGMKKASLQLSPTSAIAAIAGFGIGVALAFPPFNADLKFKDGLKSQNLSTLSKSTEIFGSNAYFKGFALQQAAAKNDWSTASILISQMTSNYPRDIFGWRMLYNKPNGTVAEKSQALARVKSLDPFNPDIPKT